MFSGKWLAGQLGKKTKALRGEEPFFDFSYTGHLETTANAVSLNIVTLENDIEDLKTLLEDIELGMVTTDTLIEDDKVLILRSLQVKDVTKDILRTQLLRADLQPREEKETPPSRRDKPDSAQEGAGSALESANTGRPVRKAKANHSLVTYRQGDLQDAPGKEQEFESIASGADEEALSLRDTRMQMLALLEGDKLTKSVQIGIKRLSKQLKILQEEEKTQLTYNELCEELYRELFECLTDVPIKKIQTNRVTPGDGVEAWKTLEKEYEGGTGPATRISVNKFLNVKQNELRHPTLSNYLWEFNNRASLMRSHLKEYNRKKAGCSNPTCECCALQATLPEEFYISVLLNGVSKEYEPVKVIINAMGEDLTLAEAMKQLKTFQESKKLDSKRPRKPRNPADKAMLTKGDKPQKKLKCFNCDKIHAGGWRKCKAPCGHCGKTGHVKHNCPTKSKSQPSKATTDKNKNKAFAALTEEMKAMRTEFTSIKNHLESKEETPEEEPSYFGFLTKEAPPETTQSDNESMPELTESESSDSDSNEYEFDELKLPEESEVPTLINRGPHLRRTTNGCAYRPRRDDPRDTLCRHTAECKCGKVCGYCLAEHSIQLARCPRCRNPHVRYCSAQCMIDDRLDHWQVCTTQAQQDWYQEVCSPENVAYWTQPFGREGRE